VLVIVHKRLCALQQRNVQEILAKITSAVLPTEEPLIPVTVLLAATVTVLELHSSIGVDNVGKLHKELAAGLQRTDVMWNVLAARLRKFLVGALRASDTADVFLDELHMPLVNDTAVVVLYEHHMPLQAISSLVPHILASTALLHRSFYTHLKVHGPRYNNMIPVEAAAVQTEAAAVQAEVVAAALARAERFAPV